LANFIPEQKEKNRLKQY